MSQLSKESSSSWRRNLLVQQALLVVLWGGLGMLLMDIRYEHQAVLGEKWQSWIPLFYLLGSIVLLPIGIIWVKGLGRQLLMFVFAGLVVVGSLGFWFHSENKPVDKIAHLVLIDLKPPGHLEQSDDSASPPILAPLALIGLGTIGILACLWKQQG